MGVLIFKKVSIDQDIFIAKVLIILWIHSYSQIDMVVFLIFPLGLVACYDDWMSLGYIFFDPLQVLFVLRWG